MNACRSKGEHDNDARFVGERVEGVGIGDTGGREGSLYWRACSIKHDCVSLLRNNTRVRERERERRSDSSRQLLNTQTKVKQKLHFKLPNTTWYFLYTVINDLPSDKACNTLCVRLRAFGLKKALGVILFNLWGVLQ